MTTTQNTKEYYEKRQSSQKLSSRKIALLNKIYPYVVFKSVIDVGCGDGVVALGLANYSEVVAACDLSASRLKKMMEGINFFDFDLLNDENVPAQYEFAVCLDVLEHIPADKEVYVLRKLAKFGKNIIINIPAIKVDDQIIERQITPLSIINTLAELGYDLKHFETWAIFANEVYNFMVFTQKGKWLFKYSTMLPREGKK